MVLMQAEELAERLAADANVRVVDVRWYLGQPGRGRRQYEEGHIPGAIFLDLDSDLSDPAGLGAPGRHPLPDPAAFALRLAQAGIDDEHLVVAYDDVGGAVAARLWWMLDDLGHMSVALLDGGLQAWTATGQPLSSDEPRWRRAQLHLATSWRNVVDRDQVASRLGSVSLLDGRAGERYRGEVEPVDPVAGHIPTAISAPTGGNLGPDGRFLPAEALAARFRTIGADVSEPGGAVITSCGSGVTACHNAVAMRIAGLPAPLLYPGSFSDWSRVGLPVAAGADRGTPPSDREFVPGAAAHNAPRNTIDTRPE